MAVANSLALSMADQDDLKKSEQVVKKPGTDEPTGLLLESAQGLVSALIPPSTDKYLALKYTSLASQIYGAVGVTTADQGGSQIYGLDEAPFPMGFYTGTLSIMQDALATGIRTPRVIAHPLNYIISDGKGGIVDECPSGSARSDHRRCISVPSGRKSRFSCRRQARGLCGA